MKKFKVQGSKFKRIEGSICTPKGFFATGVACGLKRSGKKDLAIIYTPHPATAAGVFTTNKVKAAPVVLSQKAVKKGRAQAIIINSGNANACTGVQGMKDAVEMVKMTADSLRLSESDILVASTGVIGVPLPMKKIHSGIWTASRMIKKDGECTVAEAIMTTDTRKKVIALELGFGKGKAVRIAGIAKGSGMICPGMATMICVITTDAIIDAKLLQKALDGAVAETFNMITVDNDMSTNDCVLVLANGQSEKIVPGAKLSLFSDALKEVCGYLAKEIIADGEGATKIFSVEVKNAKTQADAAKIAKTIAGSSLLKCAIYGADPNFGRILAAAGYSEVGFDPEKVDVYIEGTLVAKKGAGVPFDAKTVSAAMKAKEMAIVLNLNSGNKSAKAWGCDMTEGYIKINALYHT